MSNTERGLSLPTKTNWGNLHRSSLPRSGLCQNLPTPLLPPATFSVGSSSTLKVDGMLQGPLLLDTLKQSNIEVILIH